MRTDPSIPATAHADPAGANPGHSRRRLLQGVAATMAFAGVGIRGALAELAATPAQMRGPFYPLALPLDRDNDLVTVDGYDGVAHGVITHVCGRILDTSGRPLAGLTVEIWQVNGHGRYHHPGDDQDRPYDPGFQGYGQTVTDANGAYRFRTVRPVAYPGRAPHIHFALGRPSGSRFYTQMYIAGAPENETDFLLTRVAPGPARDALVVPLERSPDALAALAGRFDIVLGATPVTREP